MRERAGPKMRAPAQRTHILEMVHSRSLVLSFSLSLFAAFSLSAQDRAWWDSLPPAAAPHISWTRQSRYLPMPDGVRLAVDRYLPEGASATHRVPTILHLTRYHRGLRFSDPVREAAAGPGFGLMSFLQAGYAVVVVDVRGTGASFGTRTVEFSPEEVHDGWGILDWIVGQPWSDGGVGATGISYPGTTAELVGTIGHPALKAVAPLFSIYDFYDDVTHPGGILLEPFMRTWAGMTAQMDADQFDRLNTAVTGVRPVDGPAGDSLLALAIAEHVRNASLWELVSQITSRDDTTREGFTLDMVSPHARYDTLSHRIPIYSMGGWADGFAAAPIDRFVEQPSPGSRLTMGPWNHGGGWAYYPGQGPVRSQFDQQGELLRFFDHYLRGRSTGIDHEPPVHYFTTGSNEWRSADRWPITTHDTGSFHGPGIPDNPTFDLSINPTLGTGNQSRWNTILGGGAVRYPVRQRGDTVGQLQLQMFGPLQEPLTVTGRARVFLTLDSAHPGATLFVYLEEVDASGAGVMITEGEHLVGDQASVEVELLPVSHQFRRGSIIRLVVTRRDVNHFHVDSGDREPIQLRRHGLILPVER